MTLELRIGDVFDRLAEIPTGSIDLIVTSPPFLALRSYLPADHPDKHREIGSEATPADFLNTLLALTAEWGRVLAPHGSLCVELGDTFAGSGGAGGDYNPGGLREGQDKFEGSAYTARQDTKYPKVADAKATGGGITNLHGKKSGGGSGWPLAKSLTGIPTLYPWSLAYGRNLLTGQPSPAGQFRIRNLIVWARPNPSPGALGDKFRPATSYITVACRGTKRYFDLDAVRGPHVNDRPQETNGVKNANKVDGEGHGFDKRTVNEAGAPPLDWHADHHPEDGDWLWKLSTQPYAGSHYATFPMALPKRLIEAMCPLRVCTVCGRPSERIVEVAHDVDEQRRRREHGITGGKGVNGSRADGGASTSFLATTNTTIGWSDCGHGSYRCSTCHVLVPLDHAIRRPRQSSSSETQVGDEAILGEPLEVTTSAPQHARGVRAVRGRVHGQAGGTVLQSELFGEAGAHGGADSNGSGAIEPNGTPDTQRSERGDLRAGVGSARLSRPTEERLDDGASQGDAGPHWSAAGTVGDRPPSERDQNGQPDHEPGDSDEGAPCGNGDVPALSGDVRGELDGYVCPCGSRDIEYVADHWRTGIVLDPFAGSGTTLEAAQAVGRHAIGIDLDPRNAELARERVGMFLEIVA